MTALDVGDRVPGFSLPADGGRTLSLSSFAGRPLVLFLYPKDDTTGCTAEAGDFSRLKPEFEKAGAAVVGISPDPAKKHDKFKKKYDLTVDLIADEEKRLLEAFGVWQEKSMYGRKYMGVVRSTFLIGTDGTILRTWRGVSVPGHAEEVLEAVLAL